MNIELRKSFLNKLAQTSNISNLPTAEVAKTQSVSGSPPTFIATSYYPSYILAFSTKNIPIINGLSDVLNQALYYSSNGKVHLPWMRSVNFNITTSNIPSIDLRNLMEFSKQIYNQLYTNLGATYTKPLTKEEITSKVNLLRNSNYLNNLSSTNVISGQLGSKLGGNLKTIIHNYLLRIT